ncbi:restriction endonuclease subunit S [Flagellimonas aequoris]|uniref:Restriction endonuclease subunit S n=1 Tax=Flagellimonas aequoris TaxID=2306997 RepID=A0A418NBD8_9FLAO|nr:restriction endonuclease subunit S [Allomuricauda aequoris]RIV72907.1 restriction endonuclease subunit S [Allomuricauda aequoris]TXK05414.1 restriction endonuclease subunit S [Allomuricauda aequoris]
MSEWKEYSIEELFHVQGRIGWKGYKRTDLVDSGPIVVGGREINSELFLDLSEVKHLSREKYEESPEIMLKPEDVLVVCRGNLAEVGIYHKEYGEGTLNPSVVLLRSKGVVLPLYGFYYLASSFGRSKLLSISSGSSIPAIYQSSLKTLQLPIPDWETQKKIVEVLKSLDDKIDLLHRQNQTLEHMAETLFRQWFVERSLSGAKGEGDEDWEEGVLKDLFILQRGFDLPKQKRVDGPFPIYAASGESGGHIESKVKGPGVTTGRSGILGNVYYISEDFWPLNTSLFVKEFKKSSPLYAYFLLRTIDIKSFNAGSAVPTLNRNHIHEHPIFIPPTELIKLFDKTVGSIFEKIKFNQTQIRTLTALRDTLLPKLMSGEVRVSR